jgi:hypothetical protein
MPQIGSGGIASASAAAAHGDLPAWFVLAC